MYLVGETLECLHFYIILLHEKKTKLQWSEKMRADGHVQCHSSRERQRIINDNRKHCQKPFFREVDLNTTIKLHEYDFDFCIH